MWVNEEAETSQEETTIQHPWSRMLFRFWESVRAERSAPHRHDLDLKQVRALVPFLFIAERVPGGTEFRWRLAGSAICEMYGREMTGKPLLAGWDDFEGAILHRFMTSVNDMHQPAVLRFRVRTDRQQSFLAEMAAFPIIAADGVTTHVLGGLFAFRDRTVREYTEITGFELQTARLVWTETVPPRAEDAAGPAPARRRFHVIAGGLRGE